MENKKKSTLVKDAVILFAITLIAGGALGFFSELTKEPIEAANQKAKLEAYQSVYTEASDFVADDAISGKVDKADEFLADNNLTGACITEVLVANDKDGNAVGYVVSFTAKEGYGGDIKLSMGMTNEGAITGLEVLSCSETAGLGANCQKPEFKGQFKDINADSIEYTKDGATADNQIDAISGATITTKAVTKGVNAAIAFLKQDVMQG
ncbi:MAG: RnfABCDGE type electron transport complex subunit G [Clostridium sp.]|nr:RnfABCDGE type electron transport complex subunit G [Clostridium sp.]